MSWQTPPPLTEVQQAISLFFEELRLNPGQVPSSVSIKAFSGRSQAETLEHHLRWLWDDLEDWVAELPDPSFEGPWLSHITSLGDAPELALAWQIQADDSNRIVEHDWVTVNVQYDGEPTDSTARFDMTKVDGRYVLALDSIRVI
jgi:hypothetical protein